MMSLSLLFPRGLRRGRKARLRLIEAYRNLFAGSGSHEDAELVLTDLAEKSGFYQVTTAETTADALRFAEGQRALFKRIAAMLAMPPEALAELQQAAYRETITNTHEGEI